MKYKFDDTQPFCGALVTSFVQAHFFSADAVFKLSAEDFVSSDPEYPDECEMPMIPVAYAATCVS